MVTTGSRVARSLPLFCLLSTVACRGIGTPAVATTGLTEELRQQLATATYVYVSSERKSGAWSAPAEIWYAWDQGAVWVGTKPSTWRVRRLNAGRKKARIAIGKVDGPAFEATGEVVKDPAMQAKLMQTFATKYPEGWRKYETSFRDGFKNGERVLVRYAPR